MQEEAGEYELPLWASSDSQDSFGVTVEFVLYCEFRSEDRLDTSSAETFDEITNETAPWAKMSSSNKWHKRPPGYFQHLRVKTFTSHCKETTRNDEPNHKR